MREGYGACRKAVRSAAKHRALAQCGIARPEAQRRDTPKSKTKIIKILSSFLWGHRRDSCWIRSVFYS
ncbi:MAG: hypothetical protein NZ455_08010 [Bacteroidia bacterium]|nr:hypothetical protein [Bacteroidia bacterium]MDW8345942.1 hypothetical protein [Bacteroidia bacterium]